MAESRFFPNSFPDFDPANPEVLGNAEKYANHFSQLLQKIDQSIENESFPMDDFSVYTGLCGICLLYYFLWKKTGNLSFLDKADHFINQCVSRHKRVTFLNGDAGPLSLNVVISHKLGHSLRTEDSLKKLKDLLKTSLRDENDELLYGRSGYLYALLFTRHELRSDSLFNEEIEAVCSKILESGRQLGGAQSGLPPLMWQWHDKMYLGAAHGVAGVIHTLLLAHPISQSVKSCLNSEIKDTLVWLMSQRYNSGNWLSSVGSSSGDKLVQWCHGSAAVVHAFLKFNEISPEKAFVTAALEACDVIWQRGLLTKGYGICHGASGNAYSFLAAFKATNDRRHLHRAFKFADFCLEKRSLACQPDRPFSLFEGCAGTAWFLADLSLNNDNHKLPSFPAFELIP